MSIQWLREWRAWVAWKKQEREKELIGIVRKEIGQHASDVSDYAAKMVIDIVRSYDKGNYRPPPF